MTYNFYEYWQHSETNLFQKSAEFTPSWLNIFQQNRKLEGESQSVSEEGDDKGKSPERLSNL